MSKKVLIIAGVVVIVILAGAGGFWGGMTYKNNQNSQAQARFFEQRGGLPSDGQLQGGGQIPDGVQFPGGNPGTFNQSQGTLRGGGTIGQVKSIDGNSLTLSTAQDVATVKLSEDTTIVKSVEGSTDDIQPGTRVMVAGEQDADGNIIASQITILNNDPIGTPTETAP